MPVLKTAIDFWSFCGKGRIASLDVGKKTIGLAFSDVFRTFSSPFQTFWRTRWKEDAPRLLALLEGKDVTGLVVGWPLMMDGREGSRCHSTRHFVENVMHLKDYPVILWDERLSTVAATRILRDEADLSRQKRAQCMDSVAASLLLESFLSTQQLGE